jgi:PIN domain nuclease of toxin-antitoxin system
MKQKENLLIDTQIFLWFSADTLEENIKEILLDPKRGIYLSVVSVWEIIIKNQIGKLRVPGNIDEAIEKSRFSIMPIKYEHVLQLKKLESIHKDPFDRMLVSQAISEKLTLITTDSKIKKVQN